MVYNKHILPKLVLIAVLAITTIATQAKYTINRSDLYQAVLSQCHSTDIKPELRCYLFPASTITDDDGTQYLVLCKLLYTYNDSTATYGPENIELGIWSSGKTNTDGELIFIREGGISTGIISNNHKEKETWHLEGESGAFQKKSKKYVRANYDIRFNPQNFSVNSFACYLEKANDNDGLHEYEKK